MYKNKLNQLLVTESPAVAIYLVEQKTVILSGAWVWSAIDESAVSKLISEIEHPEFILDASQVSNMDTVGAFFIHMILNCKSSHGIKPSKFILSDLSKDFFEQIEHVINIELDKNTEDNQSDGLFQIVGKSVLAVYGFYIDFISFFGHFLINVVQFIKTPLELNWRDVIRIINDAGVKGVWVAMLLSFLIGITLAYQMSPQFITYGANVYIVNFLGIALLKEVSPLLTAIIMAGRTGASITAEIGTMKVQEEVDAIKTMGISPVKRLVLPKVIGVLIALPLVTSLADVASMLGGAIVAKASLDVGYVLFLERLQAYVSLTNYTVGIYKSFAFAVIISLIGCYCGFRVKGNASSIGQETTSSVVLSIISIVFADAVFAVICKVLGV